MGRCLGTSLAILASWAFYVPVVAALLFPMIGPFVAGGLLYLAWKPLMAFRETEWLVWGHLPWYGSHANWFAARILILIGLVVSLVGFLQILGARKNARLVTNGLYAVVRHPQHLGIAVWTLGFALNSLRPADLVAWFTVNYLYVALALREEERLARDFGREWAAYSRRVPFMFPFIPSAVPCPTALWKRTALFSGGYVLGVAALLSLVRLIGLTFRGAW